MGPLRKNARYGTPDNFWASALSEVADALEPLLLVSAAEVPDRRLLQGASGKLLPCARVPETATR